LLNLAGGGDSTLGTSHYKTVSNSSDDDDIEVMEAADENESDEPMSKTDSSDDNDDGHNTNIKTPPNDTSPTEAYVESPAKGRKRRLQELEDFVKSKSASDVKGILKGSTPSSGTKAVKLAAAVEMTEKESSCDPVYHEDIYGRLRDEHGNVVSPNEEGTTGSTGAYVPPGKRQKLAEEAALSGIESTDRSKHRVDQLTRQVKGQINRSDLARLLLHLLCVFC